PSLRKAAILVASLDQRTADLLLDQMAAEQADRVRRAILHLGDVDPVEQDEIIDEFFRIGPLVPDKHPPGIELDGELTRKLAIPVEHVRSMAIEEPVADKPPFRFLHETESETLLPFLRRENPQTIALVAAHLPPERASDLLAQLPSSLQVEVVRRLANLDETDPHVLAEVERGLQAWLLEQSHHKRRRANGLAAVSAILDAAPRDARRQIMTNLTRVDRPLAGKLRTNRYSFADLIRFDDESLIAVLRAADPELIVLALAGASAELVERVARRLPAEQSRALNKALVHLGPTRLADVEDAQQALADLATDLESEGRIHADQGARLAAA
ncbi:MAG TPA: FliG C-terminal domain-containing protein, partial [Pirellulales bacterium]|nr:FliG C-terminal domain-containing protein [Pirellulales bacterium]